MITGTYILKGGGQKFTPSFPRGGLAALFTLQVIGLVGSPSALAVDVENKNIEDTSWVVNASFTSITSSGIKTLDVTSIKEQVRLAFTVTATYDWEGFYLLIPAPAWRPY